MEDYTSARRSSCPVLRSLSPSGRFYSPSSAGSPFRSSSSFASSTSTFSSPSSSTGCSLHRSDSPKRVKLYGSSSKSSSSSVRSISVSPAGNQAVKSQPRNNHQTTTATAVKKRTCLCSPTTHPGSFRCSLHKSFGNSGSQTTAAPCSSSRLNARRSAMTNSLVRIGAVEGDLVRRALAALIRPSSHQQKRRADFQPRPSRLSVMSKAEDI